MKGWIRGGADYRGIMLAAIDLSLGRQAFMHCGGGGDDVFPKDSDTPKPQFSRPVPDCKV